MKFSRHIWIVTHTHVCIFYAITSQIFRLFRRHCKLNIESNLKKNLHMRKGNKIGLSNEKLSKARIQYLYNISSKCNNGNLFWGILYFIILRFLFTSQSDTTLHSLKRNSIFLIYWWIPIVFELITLSEKMHNDTFCLIKTYNNKIQ